MYRKISSTNTSHFEAYAGLFRLSMNRKFNLYLLWPFWKKLFSILCTYKHMLILATLRYVKKIDSKLRSSLIALSCTHWPDLDLLYNILTQRHVWSDLPGTFHLRRQQIFHNFWPLPHYRRQFFSTIHREIWQILDPSPLKNADVLNGWSPTKFVLYNLLIWASRT